jgi:hypothetical protein
VPIVGTAFDSRIALVTALACAAVTGIRRVFFRPPASVKPGSSMARARPARLHPGAVGVGRGDEVTGRHVADDLLAVALLLGAGGATGQRLVGDLAALGDDAGDALGLLDLALQPLALLGLLLGVLSLALRQGLALLHLLVQRRQLARDPRDVRLHLGKRCHWSWSPIDVLRARHAIRRRGSVCSVLSGRPRRRE